MKKILLLTPPFTQLNTPYPATPYLKGFLNTKGIESYQMDLGIEVILAIFSKKGLQKLFEKAATSVPTKNENIQRIFALKETYIRTIEDVILFLQGKNPTLARSICQENFLPEAERFQQIDELSWAFGSMGFLDKAKHLSTLYLEDLSDFIVACIDENFGFSRYAERLGRSANSFDELYAYLQKGNTYMDESTIRIFEQKLVEIQPELLCISVPFPGNLYSAFRIAAFVKEKYPTIKVAMGGGFANTELREVADPRVFEFFDFITLDYGELPIELLIAENAEFKRTFLVENGSVVFKNNSKRADYKQSEVGTPDYSDLYLDKYISVIEVANPMHSLWSDGRWNKLTLAHGCYWGKCTFCDISLDYIKNYEPNQSKLIVDRIEELLKKTGERGFHFVDEAAPPALMRDVALEILCRNLVITWWTNIRFEKSFTPDLCFLLKASGCIAVSGGLEVASDRLLALIKKGVTVEQVAKVCRNFTQAGIMVHAYLMYGFPTQTIQETIDSLEMVRQLFESGIVQSGFWHQFALTAHSPVGLSPETFGVLPRKNTISFANNDIDFKDKTGIDHEMFSFGLKKSLYNYMHGICFEVPLHKWFDFKIPKTTIRPNFIENVIQNYEPSILRPNAVVVWLGNVPTVELISKKKKDKSVEFMQLTIHDLKESVSIELDKNIGEWLVGILELTAVRESKRYKLQEIKANFEASDLQNFEFYWYSKPLDTLREIGLLEL